MGIDESLTEFMVDAWCAGDEGFRSLLRSKRDSASAATSYRCKAICALCPVRTQCMRWALHIRPVVGIWAGVDWGNEKERQAAPGTATAA